MATSPVWLLSVAVFGIYSVYALSRQATSLTAGYDLGIFDQAVRDYAHFRAPMVPLKGQGYNIFADHFHPIIASLAPLYWIWDSPNVLLLVQAGLIAVSVPFVHAFAGRRMGPRAALLVAAVYATGWAVQGLIDFDFHEIAFAVPLLAAAIDALDRRDDRTLLMSSALLLLVREDMGAVLVMLGLLRLAFRPRRYAYVLVGGGIAAYALTTAVIIPEFAPKGQFSYWTFDALGPNLPHALASIVVHPWHAIRLFFTPAIKTQTLAYLLVPLALLPLRSRYTLVAVPLLAERFLNSRDHVWTTHFHYNVLPWLVLVLAMIDGGARLNLWSRQRLKAAVLCYLVAAPAFVTAYDHVTPPAFRRMLTGSAWRVDSHERAQQASVRYIPSNVCVAVDDHLAPHLTTRDRVTLPGVSSPKTDYLVLDLSQQEVGYQLATPQRALTDARAQGFQVVFTQDSLIVLRSPTFAGPSPECRA